MKSYLQTIQRLMTIAVFTVVFIFPLGQADVTLKSLGLPKDAIIDRKRAQKGPIESPFRGPASIDSGPQVTISCVDKGGRIYQRSDQRGYADCLEGGGLQKRPSTFRDDGPQEVQMGIIFK